MNMQAIAKLQFTIMRIGLHKLSAYCTEAVHLGVITNTAVAYACVRCSKRHLQTASLGRSCSGVAEQRYTVSRSRGVLWTVRGPAQKRSGHTHTRTTKSTARPRTKSTQVPLLYRLCCGAPSCKTTHKKCQSETTHKKCQSETTHKKCQSGTTHKKCQSGAQAQGLWRETELLTTIGLAQ